MAYEGLAAAFKDGDVIYGLDQPRAAALQTLGRARKVTVTRMYLGCIPGKPVQQQNVLIQNDITNAVWDPITNPGAYASDKSIKKSITDGGRGKAFRKFLKHHDRYNVASAGFTAGNMTEARTGWTRTSKAGLEFHARTHRTVHFIVTGLNLHDVTTKTGFGSKGNVTSAEMRWLYRHRGTPEVQNYVRFWNADGEVDHDTVFEDADWANYHPGTERTAFGGSNSLRALIKSVRI